MTSNSLLAVIAALKAIAEAPKVEDRRKMLVDFWHLHVTTLTARTGYHPEHERRAAADHTEYRTQQRYAQLADALRKEKIAIETDETMGMMRQQTTTLYVLR